MIRNPPETRRPGCLLKRLPKWFCIAGYESARSLDSVGWYVQVCVRQRCFSQLRDMRASPRVIEEWDEPVRQGLVRLRQCPICDPTSSPFDQSAFSIDVKSPRVPVVRSMTLRDLYKIDREARRNLTQYQIDQAQRIIGDLSPRGTLRLSLSPPDWMDTTVDHQCFERRFMPIMIDLGFPNHLLIKQFERHLQNLRRAPKGKPDQAGKKTPDLKEWARIGLLPCMDLILWATEEQGRIPDSRIADALGPKINADEEKVRKTLRPLARQLLDPLQNPWLDERLRALADAQMDSAARGARKRKGT